MRSHISGPLVLVAAGVLVAGAAVAPLLWSTAAPAAADRQGLLANNSLWIDGLEEVADYDLRSDDGRTGRATLRLAPLLVDRRNGTPHVAGMSSAVAALRIAWRLRLDDTRGQGLGLHLAAMAFIGRSDGKALRLSSVASDDRAVTGRGWSHEQPFMTFTSAAMGHGELRLPWKLPEGGHLAEAMPVLLRHWLLQGQVPTDGMLMPTQWGVIAGSSEAMPVQVRDDGEHSIALPIGVRRVRRYRIHWADGGVDRFDLASTAPHPVLAFRLRDGLEARLRSYTHSRPAGIDLRTLADPGLGSATSPSAPPRKP
jgi:hypothetical protein